MWPFQTTLECADIKQKQPQDRKTIFETLFSKQGSTPTSWARGLRDQIQKWAQDPENPLFLGFSVLRGGIETMVSDHGLRPWSWKGPDHGVGVDPETANYRFLSQRSCRLSRDRRQLRARMGPSSENVIIWLPSEHRGGGHQSCESYESHDRERSENRTIPTIAQKASSKYCQTSTSKQREL